jgi:hypothetical protein
MQSTVVNNIKSSYDMKKGLIFDKKLESIKLNARQKNIKMFSTSNIKPLLLLDAGQLSRVIFYHEQVLNKKMRKDWLENMNRNRQIIENMNKQYGEHVSAASYKMDRTNGFGHYRQFKDRVIGDESEEDGDQGKKNGFFMTDVDHEEKRKQMKEEIDRMKQI